MEGFTRSVISITKKKTRMSELCGSGPVLQAGVDLCTHSYCLPEPYSRRTGTGRQAAPLLCTSGLEMASMASPHSHADCSLQSLQTCLNHELNLDAWSAQKKVHFSLPTMFFRKNWRTGDSQHADARGSSSFQEATQMPRKMRGDGIWRDKQFCG